MGTKVCVVVLSANNDARKALETFIRSFISINVPFPLMPRRNAHRAKILGNVTGLPFTNAN